MACLSTPGIPRLSSKALSGVGVESGTYDSEIFLLYFLH
jgi:hypothetical protein